jgi:ribosomal protein S16
MAVPLDEPRHQHLAGIALIDLDRAEYWLSVGARASQTVMSFINKARKASGAAA